MKYYFPIHLDGGNRGCEAIAISAAVLLGEPTRNIVGYCRDVALDKHLGIDDYVELMPFRRPSMVVDRLLSVASKLLPAYALRERRHIYPYTDMLRQVQRGDVVVFTGGDMFCYADNELIYLNNWLHRRGITTVLWGCSMGPENQSEEKLNTLPNFSLIYTRESLTYEYFQSLQLQNICLLPDSAFTLAPKECKLPAVLQGNNVLGLNLSSFVVGGMTLDTPFGKEVMRLLTHVLNETDMQVLLVPHVTWNRDGVNQDDQQMADILLRHFCYHPRMEILDIKDMNYCQIRYAISRCRFFVGARTHAVISAYSTCVPTIALGYSIKSRGIAKDLGINPAFVVDSKHFTEGDLLRSFKLLEESEAHERNHLKTIMPEYCRRPYDIGKWLKQLKSKQS